MSVLMAYPTAQPLRRQCREGFGFVPSICLDREKRSEPCYCDHLRRWYLGDGTTKERANEVEGGLLKPLLTFEPSSAADREMSARRMCNHQIPIVAEKRRDITYDVLPRTLRGEEVTRPRIVTASRECVTDRARKLTRDEDFHASKPNASAVVFQPDKHASCYELGGLRPKRLVALLQDLEQELLLRQVHDGEVWV